MESSSFSDPVYGFEQDFALATHIWDQRLSIRHPYPSLDLITDLHRPNGIALSDDRRNGNGCTLFVATLVSRVLRCAVPRGWFCFRESNLYTMKDASVSSGGSCFEPHCGSICLQPLVAVVLGVQDGIQCARVSQMLPTAI
jgi:hypothetical protein